VLEAPDFSVPHFFEFEAVLPRPKVRDPTLALCEDLPMLSLPSILNSLRVYVTFASKDIGNGFEQLCTPFSFLYHVRSTMDV